MNSPSSIQISPPRRRLRDVSLSSSPPSHLTHNLSHHPRSLPRRTAVTLAPRHRSSISLIILLLTCFLTLTTAEKISLSNPMGSSSTTDDRHAAEDFLSTLDHLAHTGTILIDTSPPPNPNEWILANEHDALMKRAESKNHTTSSYSVIPTPTPTGSGTKPSGTDSSTSTGLLTAATQGPVVLPSPFDSGFSSNLTESCADFFTGFLADPGFMACLPLSLLLQNSNSFFQASKSLVRITQTLDATCSANATSCTTLLTNLASNLTSPNHCASDLAAQNPLIVQARFGMLAYRVLYTATCLRDPLTSSYCYADAITNTSTPSDAYFYYLPLNMSLPGGAQPSCSSCTRETMNILEAATSDRKSAIAVTYPDAAAQVNVKCGPGFVNASLAAAVVANAAVGGTPVWSTGVLALGIVLVGLLL